MKYTGPRTPWGELRVTPSEPLECDRCGHRSLDPDEIPYDSTSGAPIRSRAGELVCKRCWWAPQLRRNAAKVKKGPR